MNKETTRIDTERQAEGGLTRTHKRELKTLKEVEDQSAKRVGEMGEADQEGERPRRRAGFSTRSGSTSAASAESLEKNETGRLVQSIEDGVLQNLQELKQTLEDELAALRKKKPSEDESQSQSGKDPLVSMIAELLLIQRLQIAHNRESEAFFARQPKLGGDGGSRSTPRS